MLIVSDTVLTYGRLLPLHGERRGGGRGAKGELTEGVTGYLAVELSKNPTVLIVNDTVFAHGGLLPLHGERRGGKGGAKGMEVKGEVGRGFGKRVVRRGVGVKQQRGRWEGGIERRVNHAPQARLAVNHDQTRTGRV